MNLCEFQKNIESLLLEVLLPYPPQTQKGVMKVIHDSFWGSCLFYPWEIAILDTPLCQRLRRISQLGTAFLTYPSAVHNRFSHALGVTFLAGKLINRLKEKIEVGKKSNIPTIVLKDIYTVRMAGLLHDIGHCFFSHASEKQLKPILARLIESTKIGSAKPHEFISYSILKSKYFQSYWKNHIVPLFPSREDAPDPEDIAKIIVGIPPSEEKRYLQEIINGPYDVDKLEYLYRDAKMAGLEISYDIERYFYKIKIVRKESSRSCRLVMDIGGIRAVEQIIFSKMMLFSFVYHHQKVLATDAIIGDLVYELLSNDPPQKGIIINNPLDFLRYTDYDILSCTFDGVSKRFDSLKKKIFERRFPKRCFVINKEFVIGHDYDLSVKENWRKLLKDLRDVPKSVNMIREKIVKKINSKNPPQKVTIEDIYIMCPKLPVLEEAGAAPVIDVNGKLVGMGEFFDLEGWQKTYDLKKLRGYFYASNDCVKIASDAVEEFLKEEYNLQFKENAKLEAKILHQNQNQ